MKKCCNNCMFSEKDIEYDNIIVCSKILEGITNRDEHINEIEMVVDEDFCCKYYKKL